MTLTNERAFGVGDKVMIRVHSGGVGSIWTVFRDDTNAPHCRDHEPAYELRNESDHRRYAYESDLQLVERAGATTLVA